MTYLFTTKKMNKATVSDSALVKKFLGIKLRRFVRNNKIFKIKLSQILRLM